MTGTFLNSMSGNTQLRKGRNLFLSGLRTFCPFYKLKKYFDKSIKIVNIGKQNEGIMENKTKSIKEIYISASSKIDMQDIGWSKGATKDVHVEFMGCGKYCIYKTVKHNTEKSGYKTYLSIKDMEIDFNLTKGTSE